MRATGARQVTPTPRPGEEDMPRLPFVDPEDFSAGYLLREQHILPRRGDRPDWQHLHDYWLEKDQLPAIDLADPIFVYR
jgi:hypothetical protein